MVRSWDMMPPVVETVGFKDAPTDVWIFEDWLAQQTKRDDPIGDLARDVVIDEDWPEHSELIELHQYLASLHADPGAHEALAKAYVAWLRHRDLALYGYIYFVQRPIDRAIKIGHSRRPELRIKAFGQVKILTKQQGGRLLEQKLHRRFNHLRITGEWFREAPELLTYIQDVHDARNLGFT